VASKKYRVEIRTKGGVEGLLPPVDTLEEAVVWAVEADRHGEEVLDIYEGTEPVSLDKLENYTDDVIARMWGAPKSTLVKRAARKHGLPVKKLFVSSVPVEDLRGSPTMKLKETLALRPSYVGNIKGWMQRHLEEFRDGSTGEINTTAMAEAAAEKFDLYEDQKNWTIPEDIFELAQKVADRDPQHRQSLPSFLQDKDR
jgi:hypothetical protein